MQLSEVVDLGRTAAQQVMAFIRASITQRMLRDSGTVINGKQEAAAIGEGSDSNSDAMQS